MATVEFGRIDQWMLFGGGYYIAEAIRQLQRIGVPAILVSGPRHLDGLLELDHEAVTLRSWAARHQAEIVETEKATSDERVLSRITPSTFGFSVGAPWIFKPAFIERFGPRLVNSHGTRLPDDRGGAGFSWRIMRGDRQGMFVLHQIDGGIDTGAILVADGFHIPEGCRTPADYTAHTVKIGSSKLKAFMEKVQTAGSSFEALGQPEYLSKYWPRLDTEVHGWIDWSWSAADIDRFICAFDEPYAGASTMLGQERMRLKSSSLILNDGDFHPFQYGQIYRVSDDAVFVAANGGALRIGRSIGGMPVIGDRFHTPTAKLDEARSTRARFSA
jgi:methionyl-tRNA formyltransferase